MNKITYSKIYLMLVSIMIASMSNLSATAQFGPSNWTIVDRTPAIGSTVSYFETNVGGNPHRYRLTGPVQYQRSAMWYIGTSGNSGQLNLSQDYVLNFRLAFDNRSHISDGFVFVKTTQPIASNLIGGEAAGIGYIAYAGIPNSISCEFDSEHDGVYREGDSIPYGLTWTTTHHTSFLQNGSMAGINGIHPLQNDYGFVRGK